MPSGVYIRGQAPLDRLMGYLEPIPFSGCLIYTGHLNAGGYGRFKINGRSLEAHRAAWMLQVGEIPKGVDVLHRCDIRCCCELSHLYLGTDQDNVLDREMRGRGRKQGSIGLYGVTKTN